MKVSLNCSGLQETHLEAATIALPLLLTHTAAILTALVATDDAVAHAEASRTFQPATSAAAANRPALSTPDKGGATHSPRVGPHKVVSTPSPRSTRHSTQHSAQHGVPHGTESPRSKLEASRGGQEGGRGPARVWSWQKTRGVHMEASAAEGCADTHVHGDSDDRTRGAPITPLQACKIMMHVQCFTYVANLHMHSEHSL